MLPSGEEDISRASAQQTAHDDTGIAYWPGNFETAFRAYGLNLLISAAPSCLLRRLPLRSAKCRRKFLLTMRDITRFRFQMGFAPAGGTAAMQMEKHATATH